MSNLNRRHVVPYPDGGWDVRAPGANRSSAHTTTQAGAIGRAREIVGNAGGGEVVILNRGGQIRDPKLPARHQVRTPSRRPGQR